MQKTKLLLVYRSLTYAQRSVRVLGKAGITADVVRVPKSVTTRGCAYGVSLPADRRAPALEVLEKAGLRPERILVRDEKGGLKEERG